MLCVGDVADAMQLLHLHADKHERTYLLLHVPRRQKMSKLRKEEFKFYEIVILY